MSTSLQIKPESGSQSPHPSIARGPGPASDARLTARFGVEVLAGGYTAIPNLVLRYAPQLGLSNGELLLVQYIWQHWWPAGRPHPSVAMLAHAMGKSCRMVRYYLRALQAKHLLVLKERFGQEGNQQSNTYDLRPLIAAVVGLAQADGWNVDADQRPFSPEQGLQPLPARDCTGGLQSLAGKKEIREDLSTRENQLDGKTQKRCHDPTYQALAAPVQALANEFGDQAHPRVSLARAHNLFRQARVSQDQFLALLAEAAARTRAARPRLLGPRSASTRRAENLMPYLFATLEGVLSEDRGAWPEAVMPGTPASPASPSERCQGPAPHMAEGAGDLHAHPIWDAVLAELRQVMTRENFQRWLAPTYVLSRQDTMLVVAVPTELHKLWLAQRLHHMIDDVLGRMAPAGLVIQYTVAEAGPGG